MATACRIPGSVAHQLAKPATQGRSLDVEHPSGFFTVDVDVELGERVQVRRAALLRTARKLMRGEVFVPGALWSKS